MDEDKKRLFELAVNGQSLIREVLGDVIDSWFHFLFNSSGIKDRWLPFHKNKMLDKDYESTNMKSECWRSRDVSSAHKLISNQCL